MITLGVLTVALWVAAIWAFVVRDLVAYPLFLAACVALLACAVAAALPADERGVS